MIIKQHQVTYANCNQDVIGVVVPCAYGQLAVIYNVTTNEILDSFCGFNNDLGSAKLYVDNAVN